MYSRVISFQVAAGRLEDIVHLFQECILPAAEQQTGFEGLLLMTDEQARKAISLSIWRTK